MARVTVRHRGEGGDGAQDEFPNSSHDELLQKKDLRR